MSNFLNRVGLTVSNTPGNATAFTLAVAVAALAGQGPWQTAAGAGAVEHRQQHQRNQACVQLLLELARQALDIHRLGRRLVRKLDVLWCVHGEVDHSMNLLLVKSEQ